MVDKIIIKSVSCEFLDTKTTVVDDISFELKKGKVLVILGESGSGKTIFALSLLKLLPANKLKVSGEFIFDGVNVLDLPEHDLQKIRGGKVGFIFQEPLTALNPLHKVKDQIGEAITLHNPKIKTPVIAKRIKQLLKEVGLDEQLKDINPFPFNLSGGQRQRVMIAMALANDPELLIADEPTSALDPYNATAIIDLLKGISKKRGLSVIFITHDIKLTKIFADLIVVFKKGKIVESGPAKEVLSNPQNAYTKLLLKSIAKPQKLKAPSNENILEVKDLYTRLPINANAIFFKKYKEILHGVSLTLKKGETLGVIGKSGSGKTVLAFSILKLLKSEGQILIDNRELDNKEFRKKIQIVFQDPYSSLNPRMSILEILTEGPRAHNLYHKKDFYINILENVGLEEDYLNRYPHELSGGQRQRIAIARALVLDPEVIVFDEPTSALDKPTEDKVLKLLVKLQKDFGISYIIISHDYDVIRSISHRVIEIDDGKISKKALKY